MSTVREHVRSAVAASGHRVLRTRLLIRAPNLIYRCGFGRMFGSRMVMLEHTGRRSGLRREAVLEVIGCPAPGSYVVLSGFGDRAQWYRNVCVNPRVRVSVGRMSGAPATARVLPQREARRVLAEYIGRHRRAWEWFGPVVERTLGRPVAEGGPPPPMVELRIDGTG